MIYHHVYIRDDSADLRLFLADQTASAVRRRVAKPYKRNGSLVSDGRIVHVPSLREIRIVTSTVPFDEALAAERKWAWERAEAHNRQDGAVRIGPPLLDHNDIVHVFEDVTVSFLKDAEPGATLRQGMLERVTAHPLISNLLSGLVGWAIGYYLGHP
ncbi:hypothetical protein [uncultured Hydrogenophaga sp.]|uniref:hypothetical protein n=1 Tax=uncultured Hydrogenophaga sp. TaxID=199683 RepID=UPI0025907C3A|nr:hypothetical protein [uncultured Hydrogenophaga sp.]